MLNLPPSLEALLTIRCYIPNFALGNGSSKCRKCFGQPFVTGLFSYFSNGSTKILVLWNIMRSFAVLLLWLIRSPEESDLIFHV